MNENAEAERPRHQPYKTVRIDREGRVLLHMLFFGDHHAGKTTLIHRFLKGTFPDDPPYIPSFQTKTVFLDRCDINLILWNNFGGERHMGTYAQGYRYFQAAIIVYDVTNMNSYKYIERIWLKNIEENGASDLVSVIVGTKCDLPARQVDYVTAKKFADRLNVPFMEVSSLTGYGVDRAIMSAVTMAIDKITENASSIHDVEYVNAKRKTNTGCQLS